MTQTAEHTPTAEAPDRVAPGPWLRLSALVAAGATGAVIAAAAAGYGRFHDLLSLVALAPLVALAVAAWLAHPWLRRPVGIALGLLLAQVALGGVIAVAGNSTGLRVAHAALASLAFAGALVVAVRVHSGRPVASGPLRDYVTLTKPRIMSLLLLTALCGMFVAAQGVPSLLLILATMAGLALACGGASALNHYMDRDIDVHMRRTDARPVAAGRVPAPRALEFGLSLSAFSFVLLACTTNVLTAVLALVGNLFYVLVYTGYLKRRTAQNIVIGGAAGAVPPLVGYAAVSGDLTLAALLLFLIVFVWTPPHFWALALLIRRDYEAAGVPMLPVVRGESETTRQIVRYTVLMVAVTMLPVALGVGGWLYGISAAALGGVFLWLALKLRRHTTPHEAKVLFHYSLLYLALVFTALAVGSAA
ncbi:MAG: heme o synthase [Gaiellales bacterium]